MEANGKVGLQLLCAAEDGVGPGDVHAIDRDHPVGGPALVHSDGGSGSLEYGQELAGLLSGVDIAQREPSVEPASENDEQRPRGHGVGSPLPAVPTSSAQEERRGPDGRLQYVPAG